MDIRPAMVERSRERARREGLEGRVSFVVADAQALPFEDGPFDAVITESVTAFPADKQKAVREYARVARPGGYVGLNESTWLRPSPPPAEEVTRRERIGTALFLVVLGLVFCALCALLLWHAGRTPLAE